MHLASSAGWADIRLLAPRAELRLLLTGGTTLIDGSKLSFLGEALRALLVMEMRGLTVSRAPASWAVLGSRQQRRRRVGGCMGLGPGQRLREWPNMGTAQENS